MYENNRYFSHVTSAYYLDLKNTGMGHVIQLELCESSVDFYFFLLFMHRKNHTENILYAHRDRLSSKRKYFFQLP